jgi:hypothetical protein
MKRTNCFKVQIKYFNFLFYYKPLFKIFKKITIEFSFNNNQMTHTFRKIMALSVAKNTTERALNLEKKKLNKIMK